MRGKLLVLAGLLSLSLGSTPAFSENGPSPAPSINVRAGVHPDFDRVVFDWARNVDYTVRQDGDHAVVKFSAPADPRFDAGMLAYLTRANAFSAGKDKDGNLTVSFTVNPKSTLKSFTSDKSVVIDITGLPVSGDAPKIASAPEVPKPDSTPATSAQAAPKTAVPTPSANPLPTIGQASTTPSAVSTAASPVVAPTVIGKTAAAIQTPAAPSTSSQTALPAPAKPAASSPASSPAIPSKDNASLPSLPVTPGSPPTTPAPPIPAASPVTAVAAPATNSQSASPPSAGSQINVSDLSDTPLLIATLDPRTDTRAAIFQRAGYGYFVFDRKLTLSLETLTAGQQVPRVSFDVLELPKASGFRFLVPAGATLHATRAATAWQIYLTKEQADVPVSNSLIAQPDFALGARFLLPLPDAPDPVRLTDPVVGDELILVPLNQTEAFSVGRHMAEFQVLPAAQGLVLKPLTDKIIVRSVTDGIEITTEGGLKLSSANDTGASQQSSQKARAAAAGKSMFDFAGWRGKPGETFSETRQRLQQTIVDVPESERNRARLELARFYFAHGYGEETSALLGYLAKLVPDLVAHADFHALSGAASILAYRPEEGLKSLDTPLLANQPEIELWQAVAEAERRNWLASEEKFSVAENMLGGYPEPFYSRFLVLAVESAIAAGKDREAADWLDRLENGPHREEAMPAINYLHGVLHAKSGRAQAAEEAWKAAASSNDRLYKIRAEMALIDLGVSNGSLTPAQAADRLESLRFGWRGDDLEVDILHRLGQFYIQARNVKAGLGVLSQAVQLYPNSALTPQIKVEMSQIFHDVFLGDLGKNLSALDALTLYQEYRILMPPGKDGEATMRNLAERLVAIDLLDQASGLLEELVKNRLQGEDKGRVSARLAAIRLLDHKPTDAMTALDYAKDETLPADLQNERVLLRAKALSDLHRDDDALNLLQNNSNVAAKMLRADITMHAARWPEAAKALLELIGPPPTGGASLSHEQAGWLINAAIAFSLANDTTGLDKLAIDYSAAMASQPENDTFRMLTAPEKTAQLHDIAAAQARISDVDMFQGFLNTYRKAAVASDAPAKAPETKTP